MKLNVKSLLQRPEVKELLISLIGISAGFAARKLIRMLIGRNMIAKMMVKVIQVGVSSWIASQPQWIKKAKARFLPEYAA